jgi:hypothetical protein
MYDLSLEKRTAVRPVISVQNGPNTVHNTSNGKGGIKGGGGGRELRHLGYKYRGLTYDCARRNFSICPLRSAEEGLQVRWRSACGQSYFEV